MKYWVVSPNVKNKNSTVAAWTDCIRMSRTVFMGWGDDRDLGRLFRDDVRVGDLIIVARGANPNKRLYLGGLAGRWQREVSQQTPEKYGAARRLRPAILLEEDPAQYGLSFIGAAMKEADRIPAIYELHPERNDVDSQIVKTLMRLVKMDTYETAIRQFRQVILSGPPGTGKTFNALQLAAKLCGFNDPNIATDRQAPEHEEFQRCRVESTKPTANKGRWAIVQFHPAYNYEDFVRGIRVRTLNGNPQYETEDGIFAQMARHAQQDAGRNYVLIIDEINRAHLASVLGELIYGLEYRDQPVQLAYEIADENGARHREIVVPKNLFVIGTMNTADRSIGHIDYAVRRRFAFMPMMPDRGIVSAQSSVASAAAKLYDAVAALFVGENNQGAQNLSAEFYSDDVQPGHTYFLAANIDELVSKFTYQVYPLLREYVKDGILVGSGDTGVAMRAPFNGVFLDQPMTPERVEAAIRAGLE